MYTWRMSSLCNNFIEEEKKGGGLFSQVRETMGINQTCTCKMALAQHLA